MLYSFGHPSDNDMRENGTVIVRYEASGTTLEVNMDWDDIDADSYNLIFGL